MLGTMSQPLYAYHLIRFSASLLDYGVALFDMQARKSSKTNIHQEFIGDLTKTIMASVKDDRKCLFVIILDAFRPKDPQVSDENFQDYFRILQDINSILSGTSF